MKNGWNNVHIGLPGLTNKFIENLDKSKITKHLIFPFFSSKGDNLQFFFYKFGNSKLISALVSSDKSIFLCFNATQVRQF